MATTLRVEALLVDHRQHDAGDGATAPRERKRRSKVRSSIRSRSGKCRKKRPTISTSVATASNTRGWMAKRDRRVTGVGGGASVPPSRPQSVHDRARKTSAGTRQHLE